MTANTMKLHDQALETGSLGKPSLGIREVPMSDSTDPIFALITASEIMDQVADELEAVQALVTAPGEICEAETKVSLTLTTRQARGLGAYLGHLVDQLRAGATETMAQSELAKAG